jgi:hypothetical protein
MLPRAATGTHSGGSAADDRAGIAMSSRQPLDIDWALVEALAQVPCSITEAADVLGVPQAAFRRHVSSKPAIAWQFAAAQALIRQRQNGDEAQRIAERDARVAAILFGRKVSTMQGVNG